MLEHLGEGESAAAVLAALEAMLGGVGPRACGLGGTATTAAVTAALGVEFRKRLTRGTPEHGVLPVSTPENAIVYGSGVVPITQMGRNGFFFDVIGAILIVIGIPIMVSVLGVGG
jgi:Sodium:sulfate symporter transmembrane region